MTTKVLVFENDAAFASELRHELSNLDCTIVVVDDGNVGLKQAAADRPDLILLSIELPRMNGFSVCNKLKKDLSLKDVPLILMSSDSSDETFEQHRKLRTHAEDYVHKPIAFGELLLRIRNLVPLAGPESSGDEGVHIEDDIEPLDDDDLVEDDGTQWGELPPLPSEPRPVDADIDAFADAAFGRLTDGTEAEVPAASTETSPSSDATERIDGDSVEALGGTRTELEALLAEALAELDRRAGELAEARGKRAELEVTLALVRAELVAREGELEGIRQAQLEAEARCASEKTRADRALAKWETDQTMLARAREALMSALQHLNEVS
jgi:CheY-like chemotaxis protein